ncbi:MAG: hypothetical protein H8E66_00125, partial [Planctomycetes bacterium]|nr:hypothetical protein [Planctomycetota bacterium]
MNGSEPWIIETLDFGDAPDTYGTTLASDGARHTADGLLLGDLRDVEANAETPLDGSGDDTTGDADDDGIVNNPSFIPARQTTIDVVVTEDAKLDAWLDFNGNGVFDHPTEHINAGTSVDVFAGAPGTNLISFRLPGDAVLGETFARVRVSTVGGLAPTGAAEDGEVEDYGVDVTTLPAQSAWQNTDNIFDVVGEGRPNLLGATAILNYLRLNGGIELPVPDLQAPPPFLDVNGDCAVRVNDLAALPQHLLLRHQSTAA